MLNNVDEPNFFADHTVVIAHGRQRKMNAVRQAGAVDEDAGILFSFVFCFQNRQICVKKCPHIVLFPYGFQQVADALRSEVCLWVKNPGEASLIPSGCVQIASFLQNVIQKQRTKGIWIPISQ